VAGAQTPILTLVTYVVLLHMVEVREYLDRSGRSPFADGFNGLNAQAGAKVATAITRVGWAVFRTPRD
jgi:hypothetical protein